MNPIRIAIVALLASLAGTLRADVTFAGYLAVGTETRVMLAEAETGRKSEWLAVGASFAGHSVRDFDAATETVTVEKEGVVSQLRLATAMVRPILPVNRELEARRAAMLAETKRQSEARRAASKAGRAARQAAVKTQSTYLRAKAREDQAAHPRSPDVRQALAAMRATLLARLSEAKRRHAELARRHPAGHLSVVAAHDDMARLERELEHVGK